MVSQQIINYTLYTRLRVNLLQKADQGPAVIEVITPHKGVVFVEITEVDKGMFRKTTEVSRQTNSVIRDLWRLEAEAKDYLLQEWLKRE